MGYFYEDKAIATLCLAYHMKLTTSSHVWILPAWYTRNWFYTDYHSNTSDISCTKDQLREAVKYSFFLDSYNESRNATDTGRTNSTEIFTEKLNCYLERFKDHSHTGSVAQLEAHLYSGFAYDAVWTIAYALNKTEQELSHRGYNLTLNNFDYFEVNNLSSIISRHLAETNFAGVSGPVIFDENGTRTGLTGIYQLRENPETMSDDELAQVLIAVYYPGISRNSVSFEYLSGLEPVWKGGSQAPSDRNVPQKVYLNNGLIISGYVLAGIGLIVAVVVLIFNIATSWKLIIKHSAPHMNSTVVFGCIVLLLGSLFLGIDSNHPVFGGVDLFHYFAAICTLRLWILTLGFTMSFGALFCKMCLIFQVHINTDLKKKQPKMWNFVLMMIILIALDAIFLTIWTIVFPFDFEAVVTINDLTLEFEICKCDHFGFLIGALYLYKGLLTICGLFLAYESRNVKYFYINDSRFVSITMYIVVILIGIGAPLSLVLAVHYANDAAYEVAVLTITTACFSTLSILYIPKLYYIIKGEDCLIFDDDQQDQSTGSDHDGPRDSVVDARISQAVKNNLELDQFENSVHTNYDWKASITGKTVSDGNNHQIKVEDIISPVTVRMRTACLGQ